MTISWEENLRLGITAIDEQHEKNFSQFDKLSEAIEEGEGNEQVEEMLNYLKEYANTHFSDEENLMSQHEYPGLEEQRQEHELFKQSITALSEMMANNVPTKELAIRMDATLIRYFINHIGKLDSKLADFINKVTE